VSGCQARTYCERSIRNTTPRKKRWSDCSNRSGFASGWRRSSDERNARLSDGCSRTSRHLEVRRNLLANRTRIIATAAFARGVLDLLGVEAVLHVGVTATTAAAPSLGSFLVAMHGGWRAARITHAARSMHVCGCQRHPLARPLARGEAFGSLDAEAVLEADTAT
jgi:hypothetical protein